MKNPAQGVEYIGTNVVDYNAGVYSQYKDRTIIEFNKSINREK
ncbi:hypothetical protein [Winogradskyella alexanderae]|nr:hypothetical protein [Winogradskyella alexanderae]